MQLTPAKSITGSALLVFPPSIGEEIVNPANPPIKAWQKRESPNKSRHGVGKSVKITLAPITHPFSPPILNSKEEYSIEEGVPYFGRPPTTPCPFVLETIPPARNSARELSTYSNNLTLGGKKRISCPAE